MIKRDNVRVCVPRYMQIGKGSLNQLPEILKIVGSVNMIDTQSIENSEQGAAGACMVGLIALKDAKGYEELNKKWVNKYLKEVEKYDTKLSEVYKKAFKIYKKGYENMIDFWDLNHNFQINKNEN